MKRAKYHVPVCISDKLKAIMQASYDMAQTVDALDPLVIHPFSLEDTVEVGISFSCETDILVCTSL